MPDTAFSLLPGQRERFTTAYIPADAGGLEVLDDVDGSYWSEPPPFPNLAGWLLSTVDDFWAFAQMMANQGIGNGTRLLSEALVERMTTDQLTPGQRVGTGPFLGDELGWGLGLAVPAAGVPRTAFPGGFGWNGGTGADWRTNVERDVTGILLSQRALTSPTPPELFLDFWSAVEGALEG
jgi:CubicO group peptidase (beta-lactamase class C family)